MYNVNSKLQLSQEKKSGDISQRKKIGTINVDFRKEKVHLSWCNVMLGLVPTAPYPHPHPQD